MSKKGKKLGKQKFLGFVVLPIDAPLIAQLPQPFQEVLALSGTYAERAEVLRVRPGTVRSRLNRARTALEALRAEPKAGRKVAP